MRARLLLVLGALLLPSAVAAQEVVEYYAVDAIGSVRVVFDANGNVKGRADYMPFGVQLDPEVALPVERFGGLVRDGEAGLDYAQARSYQVRTGRFSTTDPVYAGLFTPQLWNRYSYALNAPAFLTDPTGLCATTYCTGVDAQWTRWTIPLLPFRGGNDDTGVGAGGIPAGSSSTFGRTGAPYRPDTDQGTTNPGENPGPDQNPGPGDHTDPDNNGDPEGPNLLLEFAKGCGQGAAGFVDGVIPFGDPFQARGVYDVRGPAGRYSVPIGTTVRNFATIELGGGYALGRLATYLASAARGGNSVARTISSGNRYVRLGLSNMGGGKTPALRIGNATSEWGRWFSHVDLRISQVASQTAPDKLIKLERICRLR